MPRPRSPWHAGAADCPPRSSARSHAAARAAAGGSGDARACRPRASARFRPSYAGSPRTPGARRRVGRRRCRVTGCRRRSSRPLHSKRQVRPAFLGSALVARQLACDTGCSARGVRRRHGRAWDDGATVADHLGGQPMALDGGSGGCLTLQPGGEIAGVEAVAGGRGVDRVHLARDGDGRDGAVGGDEAGLLAEFDDDLADARRRAGARWWLAGEASPNRAASSSKVGRAMSTWRSRAAKALRAVSRSGQPRGRKLPSNATRAPPRRRSARTSTSRSRPAASNRDRVMPER